MAGWSNLAGTVLGYMRLGLTGPRLKNDAGGLSVRNAGDTADAPLTASVVTGALVPTNGAFSHRNKIINGNFGLNQRAVAGTVVLAAGVYGHDRFKAGVGGCTYTFATSANVTTLTITAGTLRQVIEGANLRSGTHILSWTGTATARVDAGAYGASGITGTAVGGTNQTIEFATGTVSLVQYEQGSVATPFELRPIGTELALCQRYYEKSYDLATVPGTITNTSAHEFTSAATTWYLTGTIKYLQKRSTPTIVIYSSSTGASGQLFEIASAADKTASTSFAGDKTARVFWDDRVLSKTGYRFHWTSAAEL